MRRGHLLLLHPPQPRVGGPPAVPVGRQALLPPPGKGPGSAGKVTLAGWFLIFLARFFSLAPDISGGEAGHTTPPLRQASGARRGRTAGRRSGSAPGPVRTGRAASARCTRRPNLSTAHAQGATTHPPTPGTTFPRSPCGVCGGEGGARQGLRGAEERAGAGWQQREQQQWPHS